MNQSGASLVVLAAIISFIYGLSESDEVAQKQQESVTEKVLSDNVNIAEFKMQNGIGGVTVSIHHPSGRMFIHRNRWTFTCPTQINLENGYCPGMAGESLGLFIPREAEDYCYLKTYNIFNEMLCLSQGKTRMTEKDGNGTISCTPLNGNHTFPIYITPIKNYLTMCEPLSENVTYIYYSDPSNQDHVGISRDNSNKYIQCENFDVTDSKSSNIDKSNGEDTKNSTAIDIDVVDEVMTLLNLDLREFKETRADMYAKRPAGSKRLKQKDGRKFEVLWNKRDTCLWTESNKLRIRDVID